MKILGLLLKVIGAIIFVFLPVIFTSVILVFVSKNGVSNIDPIVKHTISLVLLLIMIAFSIFYTIYRHNQGEVKSFKEIVEKPKAILAIIFAILIIVALMISDGSIAIKYIVIIVILIFILCYFSLKYMRDSMDFESEYLIELWALTLLSLYFVVLSFLGL